MLHIARDNIKTTQDRPHFFADHNKKPCVFNPRQKVFLREPHDSKTLSKGKCTNLAPWLYGPFIVLKCIGSSTYRLALNDGVEIHPIFHVHCLKQLLSSSDNTITAKILVTKDLASKKHVLEKILDIKTKHLRSQTI